MQTSHPVAPDAPFAPAAPDGAAAPDEAAGPGGARGAAGAVGEYSRQGLVAFSVNIRWDPDAKGGAGGKRSTHPRAWQAAGGAVQTAWNSVAINTGLSRLVVVDIDSDSALLQFLEAASARGVDLCTRRVASGSGRGGHFYFRSPEGAPPLKSIDNVDLWGVRDPATGRSSIDLKAAGGLIYAPPSAYAMPDGSVRRYRWLDESVPIADLPPALLEALPRQAEPPARQARGGSVRGAPPGTRRVPDGSGDGLGVGGTGQARPLSLVESAKMVDALDPARAASERSGDWLRVGFALKHNEALLEAAGRGIEGAAMTALFDHFSAACPEKYPGASEIRREFAAFRPDGAVTVATLVHMAREDSLARGHSDPVAALVAARIGCDAGAVRVTKRADGRLEVATPRGAGPLCQVDLGLALPSEIVMLAASAANPGIELPKGFSTKVKKLGANFKRGQVLEYHRDTEDVARVKPRGAQFPLVRLMDPHTEQTVARYTEAAGLPPTSLPDPQLLNRCLAEALEAANRSALGDAAYGAVVNFGTINQAIVINGDGGSREDARAKKMLSLEDRILADARERRLRKRDGVVYEPLPGKPCAYRAAEEYEEYVSRLFGDDRELRASPDNHAALCRFLANFNHLGDFPQHTPDNDLLSFGNGVLDLASMDFTPHADVADGHPLAGRTARHHVDRDWTGRDDTPVLDSIMDYQGFEDDTKRFVLGLMGRMLFRVKQLDNWELILFFFGCAGTGKSLCLTLISELYDQSAVGTFASKQDGNFPLEGFLGKSVIINKETERDIIASVNESDLKKMASGEDPTVNRKNKTPLRVPRWQAPMAFGSNHLPKFSKESSDSLGRRVVPIRHSNVVQRRDATLEARLLDELPNVCCRILRAYHALRDEFGAVDIVQNLPPQMRDWGGDVRAANSKLYEFLQMDDDERVVQLDGALYTVRLRGSQGAVTPRRDFARVFEAWSGEKFANDEAAFSTFGFQSPAGRLNVCKSCYKRASTQCCSDSSWSNRKKAFVIEHLVIDSRVMH